MEELVRILDVCTVTNMAILETRVISGRGLLRLDPNTEDYKKAKIFSLFVDVIRRPTNEYANYNYNPPDSRYATLRFMRAGYCIKTLPITVPKTVIDFYLEPSAQTLYAVQCAYAGILETFFNLGNALALPSISVTDNIKDWVAVDLLWDEIKAVCYADTALQLSVRTVAYDLCPDQIDKQPFPPPSPPGDPAPPTIPPGTPLDETNTPVSPPYQSPDDDGDSVPFPDDELPPIDPLQGCWKTFTTYSSGSPSSTTDYTYGLSTDTPVLVLPPGSLWWQLRNGSVNGRLMRDNWVSTASTPTLVSAEWQSTCETTEIYGIPVT